MCELQFTIRFNSVASLSQEARIKAGEKFNVDDIFDSNCITPGTEFMAALSEHLRYFVRMKLKQDASWQRCRVIFSGHEVRLRNDASRANVKNICNARNEYDSLTILLYCINSIAHRYPVRASTRSWPIFAT